MRNYDNYLNINIGKSQALEKLYNHKLKMKRHKF